MLLVNNSQNPTDQGSIFDAIKGAIKELNVLINQKQDRDINRVQELFDQLTGKPMPKFLQDIMERA